MDNKDKKDMNTVASNTGGINRLQNKSFPQGLMGTQEASYKISNPNSFLYVLKKINKLTAALYILSNLFPDEEPLKWKLRDFTLEILKDINKTKLKSTSDSFLRGLYFQINTVLDMLWIAHVGGLISKMNFSVFRKEFEEMQSIIKEHNTDKGLAEDVFFENSFFTSEEDVLRSDRVNVLEKKIPASPAHDYTKGQMQDLVELKADSHKRQKEFSSRSQSQEQEAQDGENKVKLRTVPTALILSKNKRKDMILKLLGKKGDLTIKDIALKFSDCSEKTIQRELNALIKDKIVARKGERRWSRYSIIQY